MPPVQRSQYLAGHRPNPLKLAIKSAEGTAFQQSKIQQYD